MRRYLLLLVVAVLFEAVAAVPVYAQNVPSYDIKELESFIKNVTFLVMFILGAGALLIAMFHGRAGFALFFIVIIFGVVIYGSAQHIVGDFFYSKNAAGQNAFIASLGPGAQDSAFDLAVSKISKYLRIIIIMSTIVGMAVGGGMMAHHQQRGFLVFVSVFLAGILAWAWVRGGPEGNLLHWLLIRKNSAPPTATSPGSGLLPGPSPTTPPQPQGGL